MSIRSSINSHFLLQEQWGTFYYDADIKWQTSKSYWWKKANFFFYPIGWHLGMSIIELLMLKNTRAKTPLNTFIFLFFSYTILGVWELWARRVENGFKRGFSSLDLSLSFVYSICYTHNIFPKSSLPTWFLKASYKFEAKDPFWNPFLSSVARSFHLHAKEFQNILPEVSD